MASGVVYYRTAERPDLKVWLTDEDGDLVDLSTGYTLEFKVGRPGRDALLTKTTGVTGAAGSGTEPDGTPNVTIQFSSGETDDLIPGSWQGQITATAAGSIGRVWQFPVVVRDVVK